MGNSASCFRACSVRIFSLLTDRQTATVKRCTWITAARFFPQVQRRIAGLQLQTAVETPELQQLGLRMELDKGTGRMKVGNLQYVASRRVPCVCHSPVSNDVLWGRRLGTAAC